MTAAATDVALERTVLPEELLDEAAAMIRRAAQGLRDDRRRRVALNTAPPKEDAPRDVSGLQVRSARSLQRLTQRELAQDLGFSRGLLADVERGRRSCPPLLGAWARRTLGLQKGTA